MPWQTLLMEPPPQQAPVEAAELLVLVLIPQKWRSCDRRACLLPTRNWTVLLKPSAKRLVVATPLAVVRPEMNARCLRAQHSLSVSMELTPLVSWDERCRLDLRPERLARLVSWDTESRGVSRFHGEETCHRSRLDKTLACNHSSQCVPEAQISRECRIGSRTLA